MSSDTIHLKDGSYIKKPHYGDYGEGLVLDGGDHYDKEGNYLGHIDPCGHKGEKGEPGIKSEPVS